MKKGISKVMLTAMLASTLSVSALAATNITTVGSDTHDVLAKYAESTDTDAYKVNIAWGDMKFTYSAETKEWDTEDHDWKTKTVASWTVDTEKGNLIAITNHSSQAVTAAISFAAAEGSGLGGSFTHGEDTNVSSVTVGSAATNKNAVTENVTFMPSGDLSKTEDNVTNHATIGSITITLN